MWASGVKASGGVSNGSLWVDRGSFIGQDWIQTALTLDDAAHDLDLSGIVPVGTTWVQVKAHISYTTPNKFLFLRTKDYNMTETGMRLYTQEASTPISDRIWLALGADRLLTYTLSAVGNESVALAVLAWIVPAT